MGLDLSVALSMRFLKFVGKLNLNSTRAAAAGFDDFGFDESSRRFDKLKLAFLFTVGVNFLSLSNNRYF
jgi:hypothetical protein